MDQPRWLIEAWRELGQREVGGDGNNARISQMFRDAGHGEAVRDEIAWCAAFAGACLERAGERSARSLMARSYLQWGTAITEARHGAIAVLSRGSDPALGHVGFVVGETPDAVVLLGGNQNDAVSVAAFARERLLGMRWPPSRQTAPADATKDLFSQALEHVLEMEGGFTDDPYDPGGPTNQGITLATYARWTGAEPDIGNRASLVAELKRIAPGVVRDIYLQRYWRPAGCDSLDAPLAFMHFDAAVNHGVAGATRMLQQAAGAAADGEIGPETRAAIAGKPVTGLLEAYADIRRARYRALPHFWRFGRGWLRRADTTLRRAKSLAANGGSSNVQQPKGNNSMTETTGQPQVKWWGESLTVWGAIVTGLSTVLPALGPIVGLDITGELVQQVGTQAVQVVQAAGGLIGTLMTIYGRGRATLPIQRRVVSLKL